MYVHTHIFSVCGQTNLFERKSGEETAQEEEEFDATDHAGFFFLVKPCVNTIIFRVFNLPNERDRMRCVCE